jgi:Nif-specific regulatory protein
MMSNELPGRNELPAVCASAAGLPPDSADVLVCVEDKRRREQQMYALYRIAQLLAERSGQRETLREILGVLESELRMIRGTIMLLTPDQARLDVAAARADASGVLDQVAYRPGEGITGEVFASGEAVIVPSIAEEPRFHDRIHARRHRQADDASFICVPILLDARVVGTMAVDLPKRDAAYLRESQRLLTIVASLISYDVGTRRREQAKQEMLRAENLRLRDALEERFRPENIVGNSREMRRVYLRIQQVATSDTTVLIRGESGTGKELVASAIHFSSPRARGPYIKVNCAALSEHLLESELFGHEKGAFTGAFQDRIGRIEAAEGGTLFLDEIGEFSASVQVKLLRVLQEREFERVGSNLTRKIDVRVVAATNRDLEAATERSEFRKDLYYRINVFPIHLPPIRERRDDILLLANHFAQQYGHKMQRPIQRISTPAINAMLSYHWPGNVRELENCIEHAVLLSEDGVIHSHNLPPTLHMPNDATSSHPTSLKARVAALERDIITDALKRNAGNAAAAARELGITARMIRYKIKNLGIDFDNLFPSHSS